MGDREALIEFANDAGVVLTVFSDGTFDLKEGVDASVVRSLRARVAAGTEMRLPPVIRQAVERPFLPAMGVALLEAMAQLAEARART